jgi:hypothetical protein
VQYSVIAYFGLLALLRYTLSLTINGWQVFSISSAIVAIVMMLLFIRNQKNILTQKTVI